MSRNISIVLSYSCYALAIVGYTISLDFWWLFIVLLSLAGYFHPDSPSGLTRLQTICMFGSLLIAAAILFTFDTVWARFLFCAYSIALCIFGIYSETSHARILPDSNRNA
jgi:hypothetical protein